MVTQEQIQTLPLPAFTGSFDKYWFLHGITKANEDVMGESVVEGIYHGLVVDKLLRGDVSLKDLLTKGHHSTKCRIVSTDFEEVKNWIEFVNKTYL
jgi:hypothetical protein